MDKEVYFLNLGKLIGDLHALEFSIRAFLVKTPSEKPMGIPYGENIYSYPVGTELLENEITNYDTLDELIKKFNNIMTARNRKLLDGSFLIQLRDSLAHGRITKFEGSGEIPHLIRFTRPRDGKVKILHNV